MGRFHRVLWPVLMLLLGGSGAAQPSVTIYGAIRLGLNHSNLGTSQNQGVGTRGATVMDSVSWLGLRGKEDLGGGWYAGFDLQHRFLADTGEGEASVFLHGNSVVTLGSQDWGEVYMGRKIVPAFALACEVDPNCWGTASQLGWPYSWAGYIGSVVSDASVIRRNNTLGYRLPSIAGWSAELAYAFGEGDRQRTLGGNLRYRRGPIDVGLGYDGMDDDNRLLVASGGYDLGMVRVRCIVADAKGGPMTPRYSGQSGSFSLVFPAPQGRVFVGAGYLRSQATPAELAVHSTKLFLGGDYSLSKRTSLYVNVGTAKSTGLGRSTASDVGIRHAF